MTGTITNLDSGESRDYKSVKDRTLIIRAWARMGCSGYDIRPDLGALSPTVNGWTEYHRRYRAANKVKKAYYNRRALCKRQGKAFHLTYPEFASLYVKQL